MKKKTIILTILTIGLLSFTSSDEKEFEFNYPKNKDAKFTIKTNKFKKFTKEWRGEDYYYLCESDFICSVLFYKLNENEINDLHKAEKENGMPKGSPFYALEHFSRSSNTKKFESNQKKWGSPDSSFMFSQVDIKEMAGLKINQKSMFAYTMFGEDLFVKIHLSKILYTSEDSIVMRQILETLKK